MGTALLPFSCQYAQTIDVNVLVVIFVVFPKKTLLLEAEALVQF